MHPWVYLYHQVIVPTAMFDGMADAPELRIIAYWSATPFNNDVTHFGVQLDTVPMVPVPPAFDPTPVYVPGRLSGSLIFRCVPWARTRVVAFCCSHTHVYDLALLSRAFDLILLGSSALNPSVAVGPFAVPLLYPVTPGIRC
jgi:hypothetical protein